MTGEPKASRAGLALTLSVTSAVLASVVWATFDHLDIPDRFVTRAFGGAIFVCGGLGFAGGVLGLLAVLRRVSGVQIVLGAVAMILGGLTSFNVVFMGGLLLLGAGAG